LLVVVVGVVVVVVVAVVAVAQQQLRHKDIHKAGRKWSLGAIFLNNGGTGWFDGTDNISVSRTLFSKTTRAAALLGPTQTLVKATQ
jgi:hypothetical protein